MKRPPTLHERQVRFFTFFFGSLLVLLTIGLICLINRVSQPGN